MNLYGWLQLALFMGLLLLLTKPMGLYLVKVLDSRGKTFLDPVMRPLEQGLYRLCGIAPDTEQTWKAYTLALMAFSAMGMLFTYVLLRLQGWLPLNPQHFGAVSPDLAFNTAASFATNTNWQGYAGETTLSYFSQMVGLTFHNFVSAAAGVAAAAALVRGLTRQPGPGIGNFWVDLVRVNLYVLLPLSLFFALFLVSQGMIQNFQAYVTTAPVELSADAGSPARQVIAQGPMASQVAIKMLGANGGGFANANAAHPYENPTPLTNFMQMLSIFLIPSGLTYYLGRMANNQRHGWAVWAAMALLFLLGTLCCWWAESAGNPRLAALGVDAGGGNMEGKEMRFGIFGSALFATVTTDASCGAVNAMHDSFTPLGGLAPLLNIQLGEVIFGGVGAGLYGMLVFILITVFLAGLMVGRTPEYLGKKIDAGDIKRCVLYLLIPIFSILGLTAWVCMRPWGLAGLANQGPHGLTEILYALSSTTGNNGSAFAGLSANTPWYNILLGAAMLAGRFLMIAPLMAIAGKMAAKQPVPMSAGSFPVAGATFTVLLVGTILIVGALTFLPVLALGPILEHFIMTGSGTLF